MEILEAIKSRGSIRGFTPDTVPRETVREILEVATRAPSIKNYQPWEFTVITGKQLDDIRRENVTRMTAGEPASPDIVFEPEADSKNPRNVAVAIQLFQLMGIERNDREKRADWWQRGFRYFDAPVAIIISIDGSLSVPQSQFDIGLVSQTICLAALHYGLGTCIVRQGVGYPEVIRKFAGIPDSKIITMAIALGYPDQDYPANQLQTPREPIERITTWHGFD